MGALSGGEIVAVVDLYKSGQHSYSDIANQFNVTRNVIAGLINRHCTEKQLFFIRRPRKPRPYKPRGPRQRKDKTMPVDTEEKPVAAPAPKMIAAPCKSIGVPLLQREEDQCPWPLWDDAPIRMVKETLVCGAERHREDGYSGPYCAHHRGLSRGYSVMICEDPDAPAQAAAAE